MAFTTTLTVPTLHLRELMGHLARAGFTTLDTGERVSTEDGLEAEARLVLLHVDPREDNAFLPEAAIPR